MKKIASAMLYLDTSAGDKITTGPGRTATPNEGWAIRFWTNRDVCATQQDDQSYLTKAYGYLVHPSPFLARMCAIRCEPTAYVNRTLGSFIGLPTSVGALRRKDKEWELH